MKKFSLIATIIFALAGFCLTGFGGPGWKSDPNAKPMIDAVCDVNERPDETQWTNLLNCTQNNKQSDPRREKFAEMVRIVKLYKGEKIIFNFSRNFQFIAKNSIKNTQN
jgi:hypothetical protein